jgi:uncharacterized protein with GYD domain
VPYYMTQWTYKDRQIQALVDNPHDRYEIIRKLFEAFGGKLHQFYFAFGDYDGVLIAEFPDNTAATACLLTVAKGGAVDQLKTTVLISPKEALKAMKQASETKSGYAPPAGKATSGAGADASATAGALRRPPAG